MPSPDAEAPDAGPQLPPLEWSACTTNDWPIGYPLPADGVVCTTIDVPYDWDHPDDGRTFPLRVARHASDHPRGRAAFQLAGGPGGTSVGQSGLIPKLLPALRDDFDLVYVDQRGTGGSKYFACPGGYPRSEGAWKLCGSAHAKDDLDIYRTLVAAHDLDAIRARLGYGKIHLRGGSYGTRLGLEYLRQHGANVVAAVLDGLVPADADFFGWVITAFDEGVKMLAADCAANAPCHAAVPDVGADLLARRSALAATARPILVGGQPSTEDETLFIQAIEATLYDTKLYYRVPRAVHAALAGDPTLWDGVLGDVLGVAVTEPGHGIVLHRSASPRIDPPLPLRGRDYVAPGVYESVVCSEDLPNSQGVPALELLAAKQVWSDPVGIDIAHGCSAWNVQPIDASLRSPISSPAKILLLSGAIDLNTPVAWGNLAKQTLPNATHLVIPGATHGTIHVPCASDIATHFLRADGDMSGVDVSCLAAIQPSF
jgi:pimeloyl-ACP methyl ester carboxylesterase